ncbi:MAG TPA: hypothetical protein VFZ37_12310 [Jiangellaceae bacterium]
MVELTLTESGRPAAVAAAGAVGRESVQGAFDDHLPVVLGESREDAEHQAERDETP